MKHILLLFITVVQTGLLFGQGKKNVITNNIEVGYDKTTFIVFGSEVDFYDVGSEDLMFELTSKPNIVKLKAKVEGFSETNVTVITKTGEYYSFIVKYNANPETLNHIFTSDGNPVLMNKEEFKEQKEQASLLKDFDYVEKKIANETSVNTLSTFEYRMGLAVSGIFVYKGNIYMKLVMTNRSSIDYNLDALMFSVQPRRKPRRATATQDVYLQPIHSKNLPKTVLANQEIKNILVCFEPFTISNDNVFDIQLVEKEGSRSLDVKLQSKHILTAKIIQ
jgi:conjugative transposon TraN protein